MASCASSVLKIPSPGGLTRAQMQNLCKGALGDNGFTVRAAQEVITTDGDYVECGSNDNSIEHCCSIKGEGDMSCNGICPSSPLCTKYLSKACFALTDECNGVSTLLTPPPPTAKCPVIASNPSAPSPGTNDYGGLFGLKQTCAQWCNSNPAQCLVAMQAFCKENPDLQACACVAPDGKAWGNLSYAEAQTIASQNPQLDLQFPMTCIWPPCHEEDIGVLQPPGGDGCPEIKNFCMNVLEDVHLSDLVDGNVTIGQCVEGGGAPSGSQKPVPKGYTQASFQYKFGVLIRQYWYVPVLMAILLAFVLTVSIIVLAKGPSATQLAAARMAVQRYEKKRNEKENTLIAALLASSEEQIHAVGKALQGIRSRQIKSVTNAVERIVKDARKQIAQLTAAQGLEVVKRNKTLQSKLAFSVASLQTRVQLAEEEAARQVKMLTVKRSMVDKFNKGL